MLLKRKKAFTIIELLIVVSIVAILAYNAESNIPRARRDDPTQKDCFSKQRILQGAVEMYNMDNSIMIDTALPGKDFEDHEKILLDKRYLGTPIEPPFEKCSYGFVGLTGSGTVFCKYHGSFEAEYRGEKCIPEYDKNLEKPFSHSYSEFLDEVRAKQNRERRRSEFYNSVKNFILSPIFIITTVVFVVGFIIMISEKKKPKQN